MLKVEETRCPTFGDVIFLQGIAHQLPKSDSTIYFTMPHGCKVKDVYINTQTSDYCDYTYINVRTYVYLSSFQYIHNILNIIQPPNFQNINPQISSFPPKPLPTEVLYPQHRNQRCWCGTRRHGLSPIGTW